MSKPVDMVTGALAEIGCAMPRTEAIPNEREMSFGPFRLHPTARLLTKEGIRVKLGDRALDVLIFLTERAGKVVGKRELCSRVWRNTVVDEGSLRVRIVELRKALGDGRSGARYVANVKGQGYSFVAPVLRQRGSEDVGPEGNIFEKPPAFPSRLTRMVGRDEVVQKIAAQLTAKRFVTIVGPGGIGKTTVAISVGHRLSDVFNNATHFADLSLLADPSLVPSAIAATLGLKVRSDDPVQSIISHLRQKEMLLVLDGCEHVIETIAPLAERIVREAPRVYILPTSRESLRVEGECVYRIPPLETPPDNADLAAADALKYPAVQLLVECVATSVNEFQLSDADAPSAAAICRRLGGIALAIELAAGRVEAYGVCGTASLLDGQFRFLTAGRRTAVPRHQTLRATLDWSYNLLTDTEKTVLRALSIFVGSFTLEAAREIVSENDTDDSFLVSAIADLIAKSLVSVEIGGDSIPRYRLLDTTRAYVREKLVESGEDSSICRRHAKHCCAVLERINEPSSALSAVARTAGHDELVGNIRAALQWSFSGPTAHDLRLPLVAAAAAFFFEMSLLVECRIWTERAVAALDVSASGTRHEMQIQAALGMALVNTKGNNEAALAALSRAVEIAETIDDPYYQVGLLDSLYIFALRAADIAGSYAIVTRRDAVLKRVVNASSFPTSDWMFAVISHFKGEHTEAREYSDSAVAGSPAIYRPHIRLLGYDYRVISMSVLARTRWLQGYPDHALRAARDLITFGHSLDNHGSLCLALIWGISVFYWTGELQSAQEATEKLLDLAIRDSLAPYHAVGLGLKGIQLVRKGAAVEGVNLIKTSLELQREIHYELLRTAFLGELAKALLAIGRALESMVAIDDAIVRINSTEQFVYMPELLRVKGEVLCSASRPESGDAEEHFLRSLEWARKQSALSWELRTATSLARYWHSQGRAREARNLLTGAYSQFVEGYTTSDLALAKLLLDELFNEQRS
jgi:predicted ATPase/DNA-binding winged helix-turn-helix (wHTH) protein